MSVKLTHEALAESHYFVVRLTLRVEVRTTLSAAHRETCEGVLENLLEAEELKDAEVNRGVKSQTALVRSDSAVELNSVTAVNLNSAVVIDPSYSEHDLTLRLYDSLKNLLLDKLRVSRKCGSNRIKELINCLEELRLASIPYHNLLHEIVKILILNLVIHKISTFLLPGAFLQVRRAKNSFCRLKA